MSSLQPGHPYQSSIRSEETSSAMNQCHGFHPQRLPNVASVDRRERINLTIAPRRIQPYGETAITPDQQIRCSGHRPTDLHLILESSGNRPSGSWLFGILRRRHNGKSHWKISPLVRPRNHVAFVRRAGSLHRELQYVCSRRRLPCCAICNGQHGG